MTDNPLVTLVHLLESLRVNNIHNAHTALITLQEWIDAGNKMPQEPCLAAIKAVQASS